MCCHKVRLTEKVFLFIANEQRWEIYKTFTLYKNNKNLKYSKLTSGMIHYLLTYTHTHTNLI